MTDPRKGRCQKKPAPVNIMDDARTLQEQSRHLVLSDILGSYTGTDADGEDPDQDADDL